MLPAPTMMVIVIKNITATEDMVANIRTSELLIWFKQSANWLCAIGSVMAEHNLYMVTKATILTVGIKQIIKITIRPITPMLFLSNNEYPIIVSMASDKNFPATGMNLSMANLAVLIVTPSTVDVATPCIDIIPTNVVKTKPNITIADCFNRPESLVICILDERLLIIAKTAEKNISGNTMDFIMVPMNPIDPNKTG